MEIRPPVYPLSIEAFSRALTTGHGRALIHAERFGLAGFHEQIMNAASHNLVYDSQCEGFREWWLAEFCEIANLVDRIIQQPPGDSAANRELRVRLLKEFHLRGHSDALPRLHEMCRYSSEFNDVLGVGEIVELEGAQGLIFVARELGETLMREENFWLSDSSLSCFDESHAPGAAEKLLKEAAETDTAIRHFLQHIEAYRNECRKSSGQAAKQLNNSTASVLQTILTSTKRIGWLRRWAANATDEDLCEIATLLGHETKVPVLINALWCISGRGLPSFDETLPGLLFHDDESVRFFATQTLSHHASPKIRKLGLTLLARGDLLLATKLLRLNANSEDCRRILSTLSGRQADGDFHSVLHNLLELLKDNGMVVDPLIPLHVYEYSPCMNCREQAFELLLKRGQCPSWVIEETAKDGSEEVRKLSAEFKSSNAD